MIGKPPEHSGHSRIFLSRQPADMPRGASVVEFGQGFFVRGREGAVAAGAEMSTACGDWRVSFNEAGESLHLSDLRGTPVVVNVFASWCPPCRSELPAFARMMDAYGEKVRFLMVDLSAAGGDTPEDVAALLQALELDVPVWYDDDGAVAYAYRVSAIPVTLFVTAQGELSYTQVGMITEEDLEARLEALTQD